MAQGHSRNLPARVIEGPRVAHYEVIPPQAHGRGELVPTRRAHGPVTIEFVLVGVEGHHHPRIRIRWQRHDHLRHLPLEGYIAIGEQPSAKGAADSFGRRIISAHQATGETQEPLKRGAQHYFSFFIPYHARTGNLLSLIIHEETRALVGFVSFSIDIPSRSEWREELSHEIEYLKLKKQRDKLLEEPLSPEERRALSVEGMHERSEAYFAAVERAMEARDRRLREIERKNLSEGSKRELRNFARQEFEELCQSLRQTYSPERRV